MFEIDRRTSDSSVSLISQDLLENSTQLGGPVLISFKVNLKLEYSVLTFS